MCFRAKLGTPSGSAALWFGGKSKGLLPYSWGTLFEIIGTEEAGVSQT
jgi:hypothetical protein